MTLHTPLFAAPATTAEPTLHATTPAVPAVDNLLGVCHAIGTGLGINPLWLRIGFAGAVLIRFEAALVAYLAAALLLALLRLRKED